MAKLLPYLGERRRLPLIEQDLGQVAPVSSEPPFFPNGDVDLAAALGWLYVAEGSNLG